MAELEKAQTIFESAGIKETIPLVQEFLDEAIITNQKAYLNRLVSDNVAEEAMETDDIQDDMDATSVLENDIAQIAQVPAVHILTAAGFGEDIIAKRIETQYQSIRALKEHWRAIIVADTGMDGSPDLYKFQNAASALDTIYAYYTAQDSGQTITNLDGNISFGDFTGTTRTFTYVNVGELTGAIKPTEKLGTQAEIVRNLSGIYAARTCMQLWKDATGIKNYKDLVQILSRIDRDQIRTFISSTAENLEDTFNSKALLENTTLPDLATQTQLTPSQVNALILASLSAFNETWQFSSIARAIAEKDPARVKRTRTLITRLYDLKKAPTKEDLSNWRYEQKQSYNNRHEKLINSKIESKADIINDITKDWDQFVQAILWLSELFPEEFVIDN